MVFAGGLGPLNTVNFTLGSNSTPGAYTIKATFATSNFPASGTSRIRVGFKAGPSGSLVLGAAYVGPLSGTYGGGNFTASSLNALAFSGSAGVTIPAGTQVLSDWCAFSLNNTVPLVVSFYVSSGNITYGTVAASQSGALVTTNSAAVLSGSGFTNLGTQLWCVTEIDWQ
jgi:hypothetical protein